MKSATLLIVSVFFIFNSFAQQSISFLYETPHMDGVLDKSISQNNLISFPDIYKSNNEISDIDVKYLIGYNSEFLYIYIEAHADKITYRDRGYQNGDGFHLTIGKANDDGSETDEFYVFGFSPANDWTNKMRWYYNIDLSMSKLPDNVLFETAEQNGISSFELLLPWSVANPYHPWIIDNIAFNLCFVKAVNENDKIFYFIKTDEKMQSEQAKRKYVNLHFEEPDNEGKIFSTPARHNFSIDQNVDILFTGYLKNPKQKQFKVELTNEEHEILFSENLTLNLPQGLSKISKTLSVSLVESGNYHILIYDYQELIANHYISVFESFDFDEALNFLNANKDKLNPGTLITLQFYVKELENEITNLKYYESSKTINSKIQEIGSYISQVEFQKDPFKNLRGTYRRAFLSEIDSTYRPYSVYLPHDYKPQKQYPLLVYLHGSGEDDRALFRTNTIKEGFIVLAPNGRGNSNCFATEEAQIDIKEAIDDVIKNFNINTEKIILSGFSMGGYGVYRTYYEYPELFSALAIISGHPDLARKWSSQNGINFLDEDLLKMFADIPIYIYHGMQDLNCPFELTEELVLILKKYNDNVIFRIDEQAGHSLMKKELQEDYFNWLNKNL
jgi:predicted esterase